MGPMGRLLCTLRHVCYAGTLEVGMGFRARGEKGVATHMNNLWTHRTSGPWTSRNANRNFYEKQYSTFPSKVLIFD